MTKWASFLTAAALTAPPSSAALLVYELSLSADAPYVAFGGGNAGDLFTGTFGFDDSLVGSVNPVFQSVLDENAFFLSIDINGTTFSTATPGAILDNGLRFDGGPLLDVFFDITHPNGDRLEVRTDFVDTTFWKATEGTSQLMVGGDTFPDTAMFEIIPEPATSSLGALAVLAVLRRRRRQEALPPPISGRSPEESAPRALIPAGLS